MNKNLSDFIKSKIADVEQSIRAREQSATAWRGGSSQSWAAVGCKMTEAQRIAVAEREDRILAKLRHEQKMFSGIVESLLNINE